jgi:UDP-glucose 4-epimerase
MNITRAIVTGGSGFIGSHLVDALVMKGVDVTVIDFAEPKYRNEKASYVNRDIRHEGLNEVFANLKPDVVFHLAAHIDDRASVNDPVMNAQHNEIGSLRVLEATRHAGARKILFASTCAVYGLAGKNPLKETMSPRPMTPYGISKLAIEYYLDFYQQRYGLPFVALRLANVYGPRQDGSKESGAVSVFTAKLLAGETPFMNDDGQTIRDYINVNDVVNAFVMAAESEAVGIMNISTKVGTSTGDLFANIAYQLGSDLQPIPRPEVKDAIKAVTLKYAKAKQILGWKPKISLNKGLKETVKWYKSR